MSCSVSHLFANHPAWALGCPKFPNCSLLPRSKSCPRTDETPCKSGMVSAHATVPTLAWDDTHNNQTLMCVPYLIKRSMKMGEHLLCASNLLFPSFPRPPVCHVCGDAFLFLSDKHGWACKKVSGVGRVDVLETEKKS